MLLKRPSSSISASTVLAVLIAAGSFIPAKSFSQNKEAARRKSFYRHKEEARQADIERERGLREYLAEQAAWDEQRERDRKADQKRKKQEVPGEDSPEYKAEQRRRLAEYEELEAARKKFVQQKKLEEAKDSKEVAAREAWAMEEYGLDQQRPRFALDKRVLFGAKPSTNSSHASGGSSSSFGGSGGSFNNNSNNNSYAEPAPYSGFDGYVPPPPFPEGNDGYVPPNDGFVPPPPPAFPGTGEFDGGFYPPPPPPPPGFDGY